MFDFEKLTVYSTCSKLSGEVLNYLFENKLIDPFIKDQLKRAIISVQVNLAEGTGRVSGPDKKHFYAMARSSTFECVSLLMILRELQLLSDIEYQNWYGRLEEISKMLLALSRSLSNS